MPSTNIGLLCLQLFNILIIIIIIMVYIMYFVNFRQLSGYRAFLS